MTQLYAFDLGDTLVEYEGLPLSWEAHYPAALSALAGHCGIEADAETIARGIAVLKRYNTRLVPRMHEVEFRTILSELFENLEATAELDEVECARAFFALFRQRLRCVSEALAVLRVLRSRGGRIAVFTDVPYGMPRMLVEEDVRDSGIHEVVDLLVTSRDVGFRKPHPKTLGYVMGRLNAVPSTTVYVGNERKDVEVALACGCEAVLFHRSGEKPGWGQHRTIASLAEL